MRTAAELLFEDFAARFARGEHPDVRDYLERAEGERDELAALLDGFLAASPAPAPSEETRAVFAELVPSDESTPPMLAARVRLGLRRSEVVRRLTSWLTVPENEERVAAYYHELETGLLDPRGVQPIVWHHLAKLFGTGIRSLMLRPNEPPPAMVLAYYRLSDDVAPDRVSVPARADAPAAPPEKDHLDVLFTGGA